jgi:hypothetical protein
MVINLTNKEKANETKLKLEKENIEDISNVEFILQHISANDDKCEGIRKYGLLNRNALIIHEDLNITQKIYKKLSEDTMLEKLKDPYIGAFFSAMDNLDYNNDLDALPEIINANMADKYEKYIITFKVKYLNIANTAFCYEWDEENFREKLIELINEKIDENLHNRFAFLERGYNVPVKDIISIEKLKEYRL